MPPYGYGPPPPPPSASAGYGHPSGPYPQQTHSRGGGHQGGRGRGGYGGRGDYHATPPTHYDYGSQQQSYQGQQHAAPYVGAQPPASYSQPHSQWSQDHAQQQQHHHAPQPLSASNYHPNYAPQSYPPPGQYQPQHQPAPYGAPQQYAPSYQGPSPPNVPHWSAAPPAQAPTYVNNRTRGGYTDRGGSRGAHSGPRSGRPEYPHEQVPPVANGSYGQPYPADPRVSHYPPPSYPYAAPPPPSDRPGRHDPYSTQSRGNHRGGRGGRDRDQGRGGRGGGHHQKGHHHGADKARHGKPAQNQNQNHNQQDNKKKSESPAVGKKKKRKTNTLGLTPGNESESEDDEGEEKALTDLIGTEGLVVKDIAAYLAERRKHFPTKARTEAKKAAELARIEEDKAAELEKQADKLRRQLRKVEFSIKRKREQGDEGDEMRESSLEDSDDDGMPEVLSSKSSKAAPPPPAKKADISRHCKYYSTGGNCGKKGKCRFVHDPEVREAAIREREANNGRLTIQQRLILNDKDQEDLTVLQSIQYLREKGLMSAADAEARTKAVEENAKNKNKSNDKSSDKISEVAEDKAKEPAPQPAKPQPPVTRLLPAAPPSLPPPPAKREHVSNAAVQSTAASVSNSNGTAEAESQNAQDVKNYQGWLLKPYGGKSDDLP